MKKLLLQDVVSEDVAIQDVKNAVEFHLDREVQDDEIIKQYPDVVRAVQKGLLIFDDKMIPTLKLREPIKNSDGEDSISEVTFITRILASVQQNLAKGIDLRLDQMKYVNKCTAYIISQPGAMLDKFGKHDYAAISQIAALFM